MKTNNHYMSTPLNYFPFIKTILLTVWAALFGVKALLTLSPTNEELKNMIWTK